MLDESTSTRRGSRLRVLFVTADKFPPFRPAAKAIFADGLSANGHDVDWLIQAADERTAAGPRHYKRGVAFIAATNGGSSRLARFRKYWAALSNDWRVFRLLREHDYSLVQIKDKYLGALLAIAAAKLHHVPVLYWLAYPHGEASAYAAERGVARYAWFYALRGRVQQWLLYRVILPACDHVFVQSEQMRSDVARHGVAPSKMTAVPSSVNLAEIDSSLATGSAASRRQTIAYLGTLLRERQLDVLIRALAHVRERIPDADLVFVGGGENSEDEALLWREAQRLGLATAVTITGWLPMPKAWELVRTAAVCVSPYYPTAILRSTSPTKLVEYMALGKPVVANAHPEQSDVVERSGCGVVCGWGERAFADALVAVLSSPLSAEAMGRAGRRFVETERTNTVMVDLVTATYRAVLDRRAAAASMPVRSSPSVRFTPPLLSRRSRGERADD
jgi:glycosyltransferase involved in cell wall biosynthesis